MLRDFGLSSGYHTSNIDNVKDISALLSSRLSESNLLYKSVRSSIKRTFYNANFRRMRNRSLNDDVESVNKIKGSLNMRGDIGEGNIDKCLSIVANQTEKRVKKGDPRLKLEILADVVNREGYDAMERALKIMTVNSTNDSICGGDYWIKDKIIVEYNEFYTDEPIEVYYQSLDEDKEPGYKMKQVTIYLEPHYRELSEEIYESDNEDAEDTDEEAWTIDDEIEFSLDNTDFGKIINTIAEECRQHAEYEG